MCVKQQQQQQQQQQQNTLLLTYTCYWILAWSFNNVLNKTTICILLYITRVSLYTYNLFFESNIRPENSQQQTKCPTYNNRNHINQLYWLYKCLNK